jgi:hypothetical protein
VSRSEAVRNPSQECEGDPHPAENQLEVAVDNIFWACCRDQQRDLGRSHRCGRTDIGQLDAAISYELKRFCSVLQDQPMSTIRSDPRSGEHVVLLPHRYA